MKESDSQKVRKISLGLVLGWIIGIFLLLTGLVSIAKQTGAGIMFILAAIVSLPPLNSFLAGKLKIKLSGGLRAFLVIVFLAIAFGLIISGSGPESKSADAADANKPVEQAIVITAPRLLADYEANEVSADAQYKNKLVSVSGSIYAIGKDLLDTPYVALNGNSPSLIFNVQCMFDKGDQAQLTSLSKNEKITLQGRVRGKLGNVILDDCSVVR
jgi:hypothetical protein